MGAAEAIAYVQGFMPATDVERVRDAAARHGWGLLVEDPGPEDDVPVKLRQPAWVKPIQAVFDGINILPGYAEADVSAVFILFFSLFFAMIVGDAGYGSVFLVLTLLAVGALGMGLYPQPFTEVMHSSVNELLRHIAVSKIL